jgi:ribonucleoside-triphosphate reductase
MIEASSPTSDLQAFVASQTGLFTLIRKRDGRLVPFDAKRIKSAIQKAGEATGEYNEEIAIRLTAKAIHMALTLVDSPAPSVEQLQDVIEEVLLASSYKKTAKAFIVYRDQHARLREIQENADIQRIEEYISKLDWQVKENANMAFSLQGLNNYMASSISQSYWLNKIYTPEIKDAHERGSFHIHDLQLLSVYCVGWSLEDLLMRGFRGVPGKIETKPASHLRTAFGHVVNFFYTLQGEAAGAQAFSNFDTLLAPFIRYDNLDYKTLKQCMQSFMFNMNVPTRVGFQTPFTNVTLDLECPKHYQNTHVIVGGKPQKETYGEFQKEMDLFNKVFFEVITEGDASGRVFTFPIPTVNLTKDFDWNNPNLKGLWEMTGKYGIPYFSNYINSDMDPADARSMCCRLRIDNTKLERRGGALFGAHPLTGSIGVVTINLPRLAKESKDEIDFCEKLAKVMDLAATSLEMKRKFLEKLTAAGLYPYTIYYLKDMKEKTGQYWKNHFSTIGLLGMNEACLNLLNVDICDPKGHEFARKTLDFMRERLVKYQTETGNHYNLEATPAEGTSYRLARKDRTTFGDSIVCANPGNKHPYYTNSSHMPVTHTDDIFKILDHQEELQTRYTGGTVVHLFLGESIKDPDVVKKLVHKIATSYRLPYFSLTPTFSVCSNHGYLSGEHHKCPHCGTESEVYSRIVGYLRPVQQWNDGKQAEYTMRRPADVGKLAESISNEDTSELLKAEA